MSMAQRNSWWGGDWNRRWGQTTARRHSKSISKYASRRILEILPGLGEGDEDLATPFNNAPDKLFNTHIFIIIVSTPSERGFRSFLKSLNTPPKIICIFFQQFVSNLVLTPYFVFVSTCIPICKIRTPHCNPSPRLQLPSLLLLSLQHRRIVH